MPWEQIIELAAQYGPMPLGVVIGIIISEFAHRRVFELAKKEREAHVEEVKHLNGLIESQQMRIDKLHQGTPPPQTRRKQ